MPEGYKIVYYAKNPFAVWTLLQSARLCFAEKWMESVSGSIAMTTVTNGLPQTGAFSQKKTFFNKTPANRVETQEGKKSAPVWDFWVRVKG